MKHSECLSAVGNLDMGNGYGSFLSFLLRQARLFCVRMDKQLVAYDEYVYSTYTTIILLVRHSKQITQQPVPNPEQDQIGEPLKARFVYIQAINGTWTQTTFAISHICL